jgi:chemotaxis protein methyltransferase CheR
MSLSPEDFAFFRAWLRDRSAIALEPGKEYLVESRLERVVRREGFASVADVVRRLRERAGPAFETEVVEALTTNETSFFRDWRPFEALKARILPELVAARGGARRLDLWSAASSSGQEAYSLAMLLAEHFPATAPWTVSIHGSDLNAEMVQRTRAGRYTQLEVNRGLPAALLVKHFRQEGGDWLVSDPLRQRVKAFQLNLATPWPALPTMDVILLRNVLIYFELPMRAAILERMRRVLAPDGVLFLGSAETTVGVAEGWRRDEAAGAVFFRPA